MNNNPSLDNFTILFLPKRLNYLQKENFTQKLIDHFSKHINRYEMYLGELFGIITEDTYKYILCYNEIIKKLLINEANLSLIDSFYDEIYKDINTIIKEHRSIEPNSILFDKPLVLSGGMIVYIDDDSLYCVFHNKDKLKELILICLETMYNSVAQGNTFNRYLESYLKN